MLTTSERADLQQEIWEYETEWANLDLGLQLLALDALGAETVDEAVGVYHNDVTRYSDFDLEMIHGAWHDLFDVVRHKENELGLS